MYNVYAYSDPNVHAMVLAQQTLRCTCTYNRMLCVLYTYSTTLYQEIALHHASISGHRDIVQLLLEKGADPNVRDQVSLLLTSIFI